MNDSVPRRASLEVLRAEASDELAVLIQERLRAGEDPWDFMEDLPSIDELVVYLLRADNIAANDGVRPSASRNYRVLRQIALEYPSSPRPCGVCSASSATGCGIRASPTPPDRVSPRAVRSLVASAVRADRRRAAHTR